MLDLPTGCHLLPQHRAVDRAQEEDGGGQGVRFIGHADSR